MLNSFEFISENIIDPRKILISGANLIIFGNSYTKSDVSGFYISASSEWEYKTLDAPSERTYAVGYDVTILNTVKGLITGWFTSSGFTYPNPDQVKYQDINAASVVSVKADEFGKKGEVLNSYKLSAPAVTIAVNNEIGTVLITDSGVSFGFTVIN